MTTKLPILVVGAGPVGLIFTLCMLKNGIPVRLIERNIIFHGGARGTALVPRTQEALAFLGVLDDVLDTATPPLLMAKYEPDGHTTTYVKWSEDAEDSPTIPYPSVASTSQATLENVLRQHIRKLGGKVETGVELIAFEQDEQKVTVHLLRRGEDGKNQEETMICEFVIGADGAKGQTRKYAGINYLGETKDSERLLTANVYATGADRESWHMWGNFGTAGVGLKPLNPEPLFQLQSLGPDLPAVYPTDLDGIRSLFHSVSGRTDIQIHSVEWASEWRANIRMAERFSAGRVFLAGDAAHCHSPFGGQGTNSGVQDAFNLAWKIALVHRSLAPRTLLATYDAERIPVIAEMLNLSTELHGRAYRRAHASALEAGASLNVDMVDVMFRPRRLLQLGVNYRWSPIVLEGRTADKDDLATPRNPYGQDSDRVRAGDRAPDAPGLVAVPEEDAKKESERSLFSLFDVRRHLILVFFGGDDQAQLKADIAALVPHEESTLASVTVLSNKGTTDAPALAGSLTVFIDSGGHAWNGYGLENSNKANTFCVIRPDGIIGAFALSVDDVHHYFKKLSN